MQPPRVELDELHVAQDGAGLERERVAAARHVDRIAGDAEEAAGAARGEDRRPRPYQHQLGAVSPEPQRSDDPAVVDQQLDHQHVLEEVDTGGQDGSPQGQREVGAADVLRDEDARVAVIPARREVVAAVPPLEPRTGRDQLAKPRRRLLGERAGQDALVDEPAADDGVRVVLARIVGGIEIGAGRGEPARRVGGGAALAELALDYHQHARAGLAGAPRRAQGGQTAADHQDVGGELRRRARTGHHDAPGSPRSGVSRPPRGGDGGDS